jgi:hypothetical protein
LIGRHHGKPSYAFLLRERGLNGGIAIETEWEEGKSVRDECPRESVYFDFVWLRRKMHDFDLEAPRGLTTDPFHAFQLVFPERQLSHGERGASDPWPGHIFVNDFSPTQSQPNSARCGFAEIDENFARRLIRVKGLTSHSRHGRKLA